MGKYRIILEKLYKNRPESFSDERLFKSILLDERVDRKDVNVLCLFVSNDIPNKISSVGGFNKENRLRQKAESLSKKLHDDTLIDEAVISEIMSDFIAVMHGIEISNVGHVNQTQQGSQIPNAAVNIAAAVIGNAVVNKIGAAANKRNATSNKNSATVAGGAVTNKKEGHGCLKGCLLGLGILLFCVVGLLFGAYRKYLSPVSEVDKPTEKSEVVSEDKGRKMTTEKPTPVHKCKRETISANGVSFNVIEVEGGTFNMGSNDADANADERPVHKVTLSTFYIMETEVTQALWEKVMNANPSEFKGANLPVHNVKKEECESFVFALYMLTGRNFRLPTEAEWEYAARGGKYSKRFKYAGANSLDNVAWYSENSGGNPHKVAEKWPNEIGLYDMTGNVWEWCSDWYGEYGPEAVSDPVGKLFGTFLVLRGGSWSNDSSYQRVTLRQGLKRYSSFNNVGLRLVMIK